MTEARSKRRVLPLIFIGKNCFQGNGCGGDCYLPCSFRVVLNVFAFLYVNFSSRHRPLKKISQRCVFGGKIQD